MIIDKFIEVKWNPKNRAYYENLGYAFTKWGSEFLVKIEDLTKGSKSLVNAQCEYCNRIKQITYKHYRMVFDKNNMYYCDACKLKIVVPQIIQEKYGVSNVFSLDSIKQKSKETMISTYGVPYNMQRDDMKQMHLIAEKNNFWIDGRNRYSIDRNNSQLKTWRKKVWERDDYTCMVCRKYDYKNKDHTLNAHHFEGYLVDEDSRYDINNGFTLCKDCHTKFHKRYGFGKNNFWQYLEWLLEQFIDYGSHPSTAEDELPLEAHNV